MTVEHSATPEELPEGALFDHVKGVRVGHHQYTWAVRAGQRRLPFTDRIADLGPELQVKLQRVLQRHEISLVGRSR